MTARYVKIKGFMAETHLTYNQVRRRINAGLLKWAKDGYLYMIDINDYYARLEAQQNTAILRPISNLPPGGLLEYIENELQRLRVKRLPVRAVAVNKKRQRVFA